MHSSTEDGWLVQNQTTGILTNWVRFAASLMVNRRRIVPNCRIQGCRRKQKINAVIARIVSGDKLRRDKYAV